MELVKKIKEAEKQAGEIIAQAESATDTMAEQMLQDKEKVMNVAKQERAKAIQKAVEQAESQARSEVENLKAQAQQHREQLRKETELKIPMAVKKVTDFVKG